jgi:hypothetical protein
MSRVVRLAVTVGLMAVLLSACGISAKPQAGTAHISRSHDYYGLVDEPWTLQVECLKSEHVKFREYLTPNQKLPAIQIGRLPTGPTIIFEPTPGIAQGIQIQGGAQGAEAIGAALLYPNHASDKVLTVVEGCTAAGVSG